MAGGMPQRMRMSQPAVEPGPVGSSLEDLGERIAGEVRFTLLAVTLAHKDRRPAFGLRPHRAQRLGVRRNEMLRPLHTALAAPDRDRPSLEVEVIPPQPDKLFGPHAVAAPAQPGDA